MPFPVTPRYIYAKNPLVSVICQLKFAPILRIDSEPPFEFQEKIRENFPEYAEKIESFLDGIPSPAQLPFHLPVNSMVLKNHFFSNSKEGAVVNLTRNSLTLTVSNYSLWEDFSGKFISLVTSLVETYPSPSFIRLGLRYIDEFDREKLGLKDFPWSDLLNPRISGFLASEFSENILTHDSVSEILLSDKKSVARIASSLIGNDNLGQQKFRLDADFMDTNQISIDNYIDKMNYLHDRAGRLLRWSITSTLHDAMMPKLVKQS